MQSSESQQLQDAIEQTLLKPDATTVQFESLVQEALQWKFRGICVPTSRLTLVNSLLAQSSCLRVCVIGFPLGNSSTEAKVAEAQWAVQHGADELDMVIAIGLLKEKKIQQVENDISAVVRSTTKPVKVILETSLLTTEEKKIGTHAAVRAGARFVKTCTGFGGGGASLSDIDLMKRAVLEYPGVNCQIKASGGIRDRKFALELLAAGATRLGTSSGVVILDEVGGTNSGEGSRGLSGPGSY